jgi:hypothetical protein
MNIHWIIGDRWKMRGKKNGTRRALGDGNIFGWQIIGATDYRGNKFHGIAKTDVVPNFRAGKARLQPIGKSSY